MAKARASKGLRETVPILDTGARGNEMKPVARPGPDRTIMLRAVIREVMEMREMDGPQRTQFKIQVAAYALLEGPRLPRAQVAELLEISPTAISHYVERTRVRMGEHWSFRLYVEDLVIRMKNRFYLLGEI